MGLFFALIFLVDIGLVVIAVIKDNDLYVAYAILISCLQFYLYEKLKMSRLFFNMRVDTTRDDEVIPEKVSTHSQVKYYNINLN